MIVICTRCQARFRVSDEKVGARGARIRCARCQTLFAVGPAPGATPGPAGPRAGAAGPAPEVELEAPARHAPPHVAPDDPFAGFRLDADPPFGPASGAVGAADPFGGPGGAGGLELSDPFASGGTAQVAALEAPPIDRGPAWGDGPRADAGAAGAIAPGTEGGWSDDPFAAAISPRAERASSPDRSLALTDLADLLGEERLPPAMPPPLPSTRAEPRGFPEADRRGGPDLALEEPAAPHPSAPRIPGDDLFGPFPPRQDASGDGPSELGALAAPADEPLALATEPAPGLPEVWRTSQAFAPEPEEPEEQPASTATAPASARGAEAEDSGASRRARTPGAGRNALRSIAVNAVSLAALLVVALAFRVLWRGEGAVGAAAGSPAALLRAIGLGQRPAAPLETSRVTSGRYPRAAGAPLLLVRGEVISRSPAPLDLVRVDVEVVRAGRVVAHRSALAGAVPTPEELHAARDATALDALSRRLATRARSVPPGDPVPFLVAFADVPEDLTGASLRVVASPAAGRGQRDP